MDELPVDEESFRRFKREIFGDAVSDTTGVYEVWWAANSAFPALALSQRLRLAEQAVRELLEAGHVDLYRGTWQENERVAPDENGAILSAWDTWAIPQGPTVFIWGEPPGDPATWQSILDSL